MSSFRPLGQFIQFFLDDGQVNAGGSVTFYETDLTTLKNTYSDPALTVLNANPVTLDAAGRPSTDIWGSGVYGAVLKDAAGTTIQTLNNIQSGASTGATIPALTASDFLTNDGSNLLWQAIRQVPDPTGDSGQFLTTDGSLVFFAALPTPTPVTGDNHSVVVGPVRIQYGQGTYPASGNWFTQVNVTYTTAFSGIPYYVGVTPTGQTPTAIEGVLIPAAINITAAGFAAYADTNFGAVPNSHTIINAITFNWMAIGPA